MKWRHWLPPEIDWNVFSSAVLRTEFDGYPSLTGEGVGISSLGREKGIRMALKMYVGNLAYSTTNDSLAQIFSEYGEVASATVIMDRDTGRSKGFGFVEMSNQQEAQAAISGLNGKDVGGRQLTVNEARPREERGGSRGGYSGRSRY